MKKILVFCVICVIFLTPTACTIKNISNIKKYSSKSKPKEVKLPWASKEQMKQVMEEAKEPISVLFGADGHQQSMKAIELVRKKDNFKTISILNLNEGWVAAIFYNMQLTDVPTLLVLDPINEDGSKEMLGYSAIRTYLEGVK